MKTVKDVLTIYKNDLKPIYDIREAEAIALLVLEEVSGATRARLKAFPEMEMPADVQDSLTTILTRLKTGEPVQYILGYTEFYGLRFKVDESVLIPRPETEELVEWILTSAGQSVVNTEDIDHTLPESKKRPQQPKRILDVGTGSGCIAITLKKHLPGVDVDAMDISTAALYTAKENAALNQTPVNFIRQDILQTLNSSSVTGTVAHPADGKSLTAQHAAITTNYSLIVSNPPYVTLDDKKQMHANVTDFEPHTALFVPQDDPLVFYRAIAIFAAYNLQNNGLLFLEINENLGPQTVDVLTSFGFTDIVLRKDLSNRDRMIKARYTRQT